jgi:hypothetical protein
MWCCPKCKSEIRIFNARTTVLVYQDGCEQDDGFEWDGDSKAECVSCPWNGTADEAEADDEYEADTA